MRNLHVRRLIAILLAVLLPAPAFAAAPTIRASGTVSSDVIAISPPLPTGTDTGDLLLMFCETRDDETPTASGWTQLIAQGDGTGSTGSKATVLYLVAPSAAPATTTNDPGDHISCRIIGITAGTYDDSPLPNASGSEPRASASSSISIPGHTTTQADCLVFAYSTDSTDGTNSANTQCSSFTNASLTGLTEWFDGRRAAGDGGTNCSAYGTLASAGTVDATTVTHVASAVGGELSFAICAPAAASRRIFSN